MRERDIVQNALNSNSSDNTGCNKSTPGGNNNIRVSASGNSFPTSSNSSNNFSTPRSNIPNNFAISNNYSNNSTNSGTSNVNSGSYSSNNSSTNNFGNNSSTSNFNNNTFNNTNNTFSTNNNFPTNNTNSNSSNNNYNNNGSNNNSFSNKTSSDPNNLETFDFSDETSQRTQLVVNSEWRKDFPWSKKAAHANSRIFGHKGYLPHSLISFPPPTSISLTALATPPCLCSSTILITCFTGSVLTRWRSSMRQWLVVMCSC